MNEFKQTIERLGAASFKATVVTEEKEHVFTYENSNAIFPAYKSLIEVMRYYTDTEILVETNCRQLSIEVTNEPNRNTTLLNIFRDVAKKNNLKVTFK